MMPIALLVIEILRTLTWAGAHETAANLAFRTAKELETAWVADGGDKAQLPKVNFEKEMVLAVFAGRKNSGGYRIQITKVLGKPRKMYVLYQESAPAPDAMVTMALTYPSHVVVVPKMNGEVMFFPVDSPEAQAVMKQL